MTTISDLEQPCMCRFGWIQWQVSKWFLLTVFFMTLFLKKMWIILSASKHHCHSRLGKPILKILSIYSRNISGKQLFLAICSKYVFRLLYAPKFQIVSTKLNMMGKVGKLFAAALWERCSDNFIGKHLCRSLFLIKFHAYRI